MDALEVRHYPVIAAIGCVAAALLGMAAPYLEPSAFEMRRLMAMEHCLRTDALSPAQAGSLELALLRAHAHGARWNICPPDYPGGRMLTPEAAREIVDGLSEAGTAQAIVGQ